jgi:creatinine amidohydrolase
MVVELGRSASGTFGRVVLVSAHGGNAAALNRAVRRLRLEGRSVLAWSPSWRGDAHAGRVETSVMLALHPERVALGRATAGNAAPIETLWRRLESHGVRAVAPNGVLGDPSGASADEGDRLLEEAAADLVTTVTGRACEPPAA